MSKLFKIMLTIMCTLLVFSNNPVKVYAENQSTEVYGSAYETNDTKFNYEYFPVDYEKTTESSAFGSFRINGTVSDVGNKDGFTSYAISSNSASLTYSYGDTLLNASEEEWHLIADSGKNLGKHELNSKIGKGAMVIFTSRDRNTWIPVYESTNFFETKPVNVDAVYDCQKIQLTNGTFYKAVVAYELERKTGEKSFLFVKSDTTETKKVLEVYDFYLYDPTTPINKDTTQYKLTNIDSKINTGPKDNGYSGNEPITDKDPHYGWELGAFYISDYSSVVKDPDSNDDTMVFLKNVGDEVTLSFTLFQEITKLNDDSSLYINKDSDGRDNQYETIKQNFGKGTLIIQYTDYQNQKHDPMVYTNFLEANASPNANTVISLFEEGDYEVSLDYEIKHDKTKVIGISVFPEINHYKIHFVFKVRNGNCMVYPFDPKTGSELTSGSIAPNGFYLDLARSRYLDISIKKDVMKNTADGLVEDTRFNRSVKDGAQFTDDGIYTITVSNRYTGVTTPKRIYVGENPILTAYMYTGLSITELKQLIDKGAEIKEDGTIVMPVVQETSERKENETTEVTASGPVSQDTEDKTISTTETKKQSFAMPVAIGSISAVAVIGAYLFVNKAKKKKEEERRLQILKEKQLKAEQELIEFQQRALLEDKKNAEENN